MPSTLPHVLLSLAGRDSSPQFTNEEIKAQGGESEAPRDKGVGNLASSTRVLVEWGRGWTSHLFRRYFGSCSVWAWLRSR